MLVLLQIKLISIISWQLQRALAIPQFSFSRSSGMQGREGALSFNGMGPASQTKGTP